MFWKIDKLNVFFLTKTFFDNIRPIIGKKVMTSFRHGVKGRSQKGVGATGSDPSKRHDLSKQNQTEHL
jgi:hypothetical protein